MRKHVISIVKSIDIETELKWGFFLGGGHTSCGIKN